MRNDIVHIGADELTYEIRGIMNVARDLEKMGVPMVWENIGDPVAKGASMPAWIRDIVVRAVRENDECFGYCPTQGLFETRAFLAERAKTNAPRGLSPDDILFFNGLGDAIANIYTYLNARARVIGPSPAYPAHSSAEGAHAGERHITYNLNPERNWLPDLHELRNKVTYNPAISGILVVNPGNPTGQTVPKEVLEEIVGIADEFDLFLISDEIYGGVVHNPEEMVSVAEIVGEVPALVMKGLSKEVPWPGARCGWIEVYNRARDGMFDRYIRTLVDAKALEVCATTLPQAIIPEVFSDPRYEATLKERSAAYARRARIACDIFRSVPGIIAPLPNAAFYLSVVFEDGALTDSQTLPVEDSGVREYIARAARGVCADKRFAYYLMAHAGVCVVPLSGLNSRLSGFRMTLLEPDEAVFANTVENIARAITAYVRG